MMPTYNRGHYLGETLDNLLEQTYKNIEIIVVDDGSTDSTPRLMQYFTNKYPKKIKYYQCKHSGIAKTRNFAIKQTKGEYLAVTDSDDLCAVERIQREMDVFNKNPDIDFVYSGYMEADEHMQGKSEVQPPHEFTAEGIKANTTIPHGALIAKRRCFIEHPYNDTFIANDDKKLFWDWFRAGYKCKYVDSMLYLKRNHEGTVSYDKAKIIHKLNQQIDAEIDKYLAKKK